VLPTETGSRNQLLRDIILHSVVNTLGKISPFHPDGLAAWAAIHSCLEIYPCDESFPTRLRTERQHKIPVQNYTSSGVAGRSCTAALC